jgi:hypothetical protein
MVRLRSDISPKKKYILGLGPKCELKPKPKTIINSEFNSIHFCVEINKRLKFLKPKSFWVLKNPNFFKNFEKIQTFLDPNTFGFQKF